MDNLVSFINRFTEYVILFFVFIVVIAVATTIGILLRKNKNKKALLNAAETTKNSEETQ